MTTHPSIEQVEAAVRSVLLRRPGAARLEPEVFHGRLLSLRVVEALSVGTREVRIAPGTVVTPLARESLKRRGIEVRLVSRAADGFGRGRGEWGFAIATESGVAAALRRAWLDDPLPWVEIASETNGTARWVIEGEGRGALLVTDEASVAVWRTCRLAGVRAAAVADLDAVGRAVRSLGVNLLVVEPAGKSIALLQQLGREFRRAGAPEAPVGLVEEEEPCGLPR